MKKILVSFFSVATVFVLYWVLRCSLNFSYIVGLANMFPQDEYRILFSEHLAEMASFVVLLLLGVNCILMLLFRGEPSEICKKVYKFKTQIIDMVILVALCILLLFVVTENLNVVAIISGFAVPFSMILVVINTVGLVRSNTDK